MGKFTLNNLTSDLYRGSLKRNDAFYVLESQDPTLKARSQMPLKD